MSKLSFSVYLNAYSDSNPSNNPSLSNFKWNREISCLPVANPDAHAFSLAPGETKSLFSGIRTLAQDNTTEYSIALKSLTTNTYVLSNSGGTAPNFRTPRSTGADATTQVSVAQNGPLLTFSSVSVAVAAFFTGQIVGMTTDVTITASTAGAAGNSIALPADGTSTVSVLIATWNTNNPSNQVALTTGDGSQIPTSGTIDLAGGKNAGTAFNLSGAQVGDTAFIAGPFNPSNQGFFKILSLTATSLTVENELGVPEGPLTLGSSFASDIEIYSAAGVQVGDTLQISGGFSIVSQASYPITAVYANSVEFYANNVIPVEGPILTEAIAIYSSAKQLVYFEADQNVAVSINGSAAGVVQPFVLNQNSPFSVKPGVFMLKSVMYSMSVTNNSTNTANCFLASAE